MKSSDHADLKSRSGFTRTETQQLDNPFTQLQFND